MTQSLNGVWTHFASAYLHVSDLATIYQLGLCALLFLPLTLCFAGRPSQPLLHKGMIPDAMYWLIGPALIYSHVTTWLSQTFFDVLLDSGLYSYERLSRLEDGLPPISSLPVVLQALLILLALDVIQYWTHRMFHTAAFWKYHAIHHSAVNVDWLTSFRFHPVDIVIHSTCAYVVVYVIGFSPEAWLLLYPFNLVFSLMVHANLSWSFGPFRYLLVSPVFHRWHHTHPDEGGNKNFAPTFPFLDLLFGTYYEQKGVQPGVFGTPNDPVSDVNILQQLVYPFLERAVAESALEARVSQTS
jgi:sterol desaturase/sphingolipid hydroxylase (fatty acid hydroxylase superfamily)